MKKLLLLFLFYLTFSTKLFSCSSSPISFCQTSASESFKDNLVAFGKITAKDADGINFEIIDVLQGTENRTTIRIWDGKDFDCNGIWSMSASKLGAINETIIIILPKIKEKKSDWEVIGDYRRPDFFGYTSSLIVENNIVSGLIINPYSPFDNKVEKVNYTNFKQSWQSNQNCSSIVPLSNSTYNIEDNIKIVPLSENIFKIVAHTSTKYKINIFNVYGLKLESEDFLIKELEIDLSSYASGLYFLNIAYQNNDFKTFKILKK